MQTWTHHSYGYCYSALLTTLFAFFLANASCFAQTIGLFYHKDYVQIEDGNLFAEASNLQNTLNDFDYDLNYIEEFNEESILAADLIIIPELERKNLYLDLTQAQKNELEAYVRNGGGLIISGVVAPNEANNKNAVDLLNGVFNFQLKSDQFTLTGFSDKSNNVPYEEFSDSPQEIINNNAIAFITGGLPKASTQIYIDQSNENHSSVALIEYGQGKIVYLGWGWWNALPFGSQDGGWFEILRNSINLVSCESPILEGPSELTFDLPEEGELQLPFQSLGFTANVCTNDFETKLSQETFNCDHIGENQITIEVIDDLGRIQTASLILNIADPNQICSSIAQTHMNIKGNVLDQHGAPIDQAQIEVTGEISFNSTIAELGSFTIDNALIEDHFSVSAKKDDHLFNGITTLDMVLINKHIIGKQIFDSPYEFIAADINNNGEISAIDVVELRELILFRRTAFANQDSWQIIPNFVDLSDPLSASIDGQAELDFNDWPESLDFTGVKIGDINGSADPAYRSDQIVKLTTQELFFQAGEEIKLDLQFENADALEGFQFGLAIDQEYLKFKNCSSNLNSFGPSSFNFIRKQLLINHAQAFDESQNKISISFIANKAGKLSQVLSLDNRLLNAEAYLENIEIGQVILEFDPSPQDVMQNNDLAQVQPNPFKTESTITFESQKREAAELKVYDSKGSLILEKNLLTEMGLNKISITDAELPNYGVYHFILQTDVNTYQGKMIKM